jgi:Methane oxygenase PmoA
MFLILMAATAQAADEVVSFDLRPDHLRIRVDDRPFASYVFRDGTILRPYFAGLSAPNGIQATRNLPPVSGLDATDHDTMHPGLWLAFGDISGADFWRNKSTVEHVEFVESPKSQGRTGHFAVKNRYRSGQATICEESCRVAIVLGASGYWIVLDSTFTGPESFYFGDQEEMGLGVRVATPLAVKNGGRLTNSDGQVNEKQVWGKQADWCDYSGVIKGQELGIMLVPCPENFCRSWFHARDYGFVAANPFGRNAFTKAEKSKIVVAKGESLRVRYAVLVHAGHVDLARAYCQARELFDQSRK